MINIDNEKLNIKFDETKSFLDYYNMYGQKLVDEYSKDLDEKVAGIKRYLDQNRELGLDFDLLSLQRICVDLSTCLYYTNDKLEKLNLMNEMSKICYKDVYNTAYLEKQGTTEAGKKFSVPQLQAYADQQAMEEKLVNFIYERAAAVLKGKIDSGYELLKSCSKALSGVIQSMQNFRG